MHDANYEGGIWADWPPMPAPVKVLAKYVFGPLNSNVVKFGPCDTSGNMRPLYAVPEDAEAGS